MDRSLEMGDVGTVTGRDGLWVIYGGAPPPLPFVPCNVGAREAAEPADAITVWNGRELVTVWRHEFTPSPAP